MRYFGLIGYPLTHSFSPHWFGEFFAKQGLNHHQYDVYPIQNLKGLRALFEQNTQLHGLNVTIPFKEQVMAMLDWVEPTAHAVGAVNCIAKIMNKNHWELHGFNTDVIGFRTSLCSFYPHLTPSYKALIFGNGGAAKAAQHVLNSLGIHFETVTRSKQIGTITYDELLQNPSLAKASLIWIQTTPCGMFPNTNASLPLPYSVLTPNHGLFDMIYNPAETLTMTKAKNHGAQVCNGYAMLEEQALASARIWKLM